jgi:alkylhydroperoxidase family enzyme
LKVPEAAVDDHLEGRSHDPRTAAILALALEIVENRGDVSDQSIEKARTAGLSNADLVETVSHVAVNVFTNYLNNLARTDIDFPLRRARAA